MVDLPSKLAFEIVSDLLSERISDEKRTSIFEELVSRPITSDLLAEGVQALRKNMIPVQLNTKDTIDTCGTGGSGKKTINTSTLTAFIVAAAGGKVAKHGNRSASGNCGCFDLLEKLGVRIDLDPSMEQKIFEELGIVFLFAPSHHPSLKHVALLRKQYRKKTVFNLIGPLCNPAGVTSQLIGSGNDEHANIIAHALHDLSTQNSLVVTGQDGLDEVTLTAKTTVRKVSQNGIVVEEFDPREVEMELVTDNSIEGGDADANAQVFLEISQGSGPEAMQNLVIVNAAHALLLTPLTKTINEAINLASETLKSGTVFDLFSRYKAYTASLS